MRTLAASQKFKNTPAGKIPADWQCHRLEEVAHVQTGLSKSAARQGDMVQLPYLCVANVQDGHLDLSEVKVISVPRGSIDRFSLKPGDVVLTEGGDHDKLGRGFVWHGQISPCVHQNHIFAVRPHAGIVSSEFLALLTQSDYGRAYFSSCAKRTTNLASINASQLKSFPLPLPKYSEQEVIAGFFTVADGEIKNLEGLVAANLEQKRGLIQQLLSGKRRFKGISRSGWKTVRLKEIAERISRTNDVGCTTVLTSSGEHGLVDQRDYFNRRVASAEVAHYLLIRKGVFAYNRSSSADYPFGAIKRLDRYEQGVLYLTFSLRKDAPVDSDFAAHLFESGAFNPQLRRICEEGARAHGLLSVAADDFFSMSFLLPPLHVQKRIAATLNTCDHEIDLLEKQADALREQKRGLMRKLLTGQIRLHAAQV